MRKLKVGDWIRWKSDGNFGKIIRARNNGKYRVNWVRWDSTEEYLNRYRDYWEFANWYNTELYQVLTGDKDDK